MSNSRDPIAGLWAGVPVYLCPLCAFDSEQREKTVDHITDAHPIEPAIVLVQPVREIEPTADGWKQFEADGKPVVTKKPKEKVTDG